MSEWVMETGMQEVGRLVEQEADPVAALLTAVRAATGVLGLNLAVTGH